MAFKNFTFMKLYVSFLLSILFFVSLCVANNVPPETICKGAINPAYCKTVLGNQNGNMTMVAFLFESPYHNPVSS